MCTATDGWQLKNNPRGEESGDTIPRVKSLWSSYTGLYPQHEPPRRPTPIRTERAHAGPCCKGTFLRQLSAPKLTGLYLSRFGFTKCGEPDHAGLAAVGGVESRAGFCERCRRRQVYVEGNAEADCHLLDAASDSHFQGALLSDPNRLRHSSGVSPVCLPTSVAH